MMLWSHHIRTEKVIDSIEYMERGKATWLNVYCAILHFCKRSNKYVNETTNETTPTIQKLNTHNYNSHYLAGLVHRAPPEVHQQQYKVQQHKHHLEPPHPPKCLQQKQQVHQVWMIILCINIIIMEEIKLTCLL